MAVLTFSINNQELIRTDNQLVVGGTYKYLYAMFEFSDDWNSVSINAIFSSDGIKTYAMPVLNNICLVPWEVIVSPNFTLAMYGFKDGKKITTNELMVPVTSEPSTTGEVPSPPPTPTDYEAYVELLNKYKAECDQNYETFVSNIDLSGNTITALNKSGVSVDSVSLTTNNVTATTTNRYVPEIPSSNSSSMYLNGDGVFVSIVTGGATSVENLYLSNTASDVSGYKTINYAAASTATEISVSCTNSADVLSYSYLYPTAIGTTTIDAGMWKSSFSMKSSVTNGINRLRLDCFVRTTSGTETILFSKYTVSVNTTSYSRYSTETNRNIFTVNSTDRLGFRVYGNTDRAASTTITYRIGGADPSYINTPLPLRHAELRDKNGESGYQHLTQTQVDKLNGIETGAQVNTVTGIKGSAETDYRVGNVNITAANIGLGNVNNTADSVKSVASAVTATKLGSTTVGSGTQPIFLNTGTATASTSTVGGTTQPVYMNTGVISPTTYSLSKSVPADAVFTDTHYTSSNVVGGTATDTTNSSTALSNGNVFLNSVENGAVTSSNKITGSGNTTVTSDTSGNIIVTSSGSSLSGTIGSGTQPIYLSDGTLTASASTVGSVIQPICLINGVLTATTNSTDLVTTTQIDTLF